MVACAVLALRTTLRRLAFVAVLNKRDKFSKYNKMENEAEKIDNQQGNGVLPCVSGSSIVIPKPKLKFEGLDNIAIVGEKDIPISELFELHLKLENYLKSRHEAIINESGLIVAFKNYR